MTLKKKNRRGRAIPAAAVNEADFYCDRLAIACKGAVPRPLLEQIGGKP